MENLRPFEHSGMIQIMVYLVLRTNKEEPATFTEIRDNVRVPQATIRTALNILKTMDLISENEQTGFPGKHYFELTVKGKELASYFLRVYWFLK